MSKGETCTCSAKLLKYFLKIHKKYLFHLVACNFIKKETLEQVISYEFLEISKKILSYRTPPVAASVLFLLMLLWRSE